MNPRIYTYKITFEEVPYWYWGVHKEKKAGEAYWGSPKTNKWVWDFYTPVIQILEMFPNTAEGWAKAQLLEDRLILPDLDNPLCLNERCNVRSSLKSLIKGGQVAGKVTGKRAVEEGTGIFSLNYKESEKYKEDRRDAGTKGGPKAGKISHEKKVGCHSEEYKASAKYKEDRKRNAQTTNSQTWESTIDGFRSTPGNVAKHNRSKGWDPDARIRVS
jgi:hypothetical protein